MAATRYDDKDMEYNRTDKEIYDSAYSPAPPAYGTSSVHHASAWENFRDSFKRDPNAAVTPKGVVGANGRVFDPESAAFNTANSPLARKLKGRHLQMIAIGGSIGTGLFVGSGSALHTGGPASLMAVLFPVAGSFSAYSTRFLDPAWGFAMGWNYAMQWLVVLPLEIIAASITIQFWNHGTVNSAAWVILFLLLIICINFFGVRGYGEAEFVFAIIKVIAIIGFIILGIVLAAGGGPQGGYIGGKYWVGEPGAFHNGFKGLCSVFVTAAFAFGGTELVGLAAAETANPRKSLPTAIKQVFWRITLFYIVSLTLIGLLVPYTEPRLINGTSGADATASPFVIAIENAGISGLPSVFNVVIMIAVLSVGNSAVYGSSRTLAALADQGQAPKILGYVDRNGRPLVAIIVASALGFLCFFAANSDVSVQAFNWMLALSGLSSIFTWGSICLAHIRFRKAWRVQGHSLDELPFRSQPGIIGSWIGFNFNCLVLIAQFWTGFAPVNYGDNTPAVNAENFFLAYLAAPIVLICYFGYKVIYKTRVMRSHTMDLQTGRRDINLTELIAEERAERAQWPKWKKAYKFFC